MKQVYNFIFTIILGLSTILSFGNITMENDSVSLGAGYTNDIYYSFENGQIASVVRQNWDIGFYTSPWSAGIITNGANGVELYLYPVSDTSAWSSIDTAGLSTWPILYNSPNEWEDGAFNRHALGHPDYGWGVYNTITHDVVGDSIYLLKFTNGNIKKFWIERKISMLNTFYFKYADLDGANEISEILTCNDYTDKNFVYYSMQTGEVLDREPDSDTWDILFTKYMGINNEVPYPVTGALNNINIPANKFEEVDPDFEDWSAVPMDSTKSPIGYDWKYFDLGSFTYIVEDSLVYFVRNAAGDVYKLVFSEFDYTIGKVVFAKSLVSPAAINELYNEASFLIYPNPATDFISIDVIEGDDWNEVVISDFTGKTVFNTEISVMNGTIIPIGNFSGGLYFVALKSTTRQQIRKLIIRDN